MTHKNWVIKEVLDSFFSSFPDVLNYKIYAHGCIPSENTTLLNF